MYSASIIRLSYYFSLLLGGKTADPPRITVSAATGRRFPFAAIHLPAPAWYFAGRQMTALLAGALLIAAVTSAGAITQTLTLPADSSVDVTCHVNGIGGNAIGNPNFLSLAGDGESLELDFFDEVTQTVTPVVYFGGSWYNAVTAAPADDYMWLRCETVRVHNYSTQPVTLTLTGTVQDVKWTGAVNGNWDINTTKNWTANGLPAPFCDYDDVIFDDTATGTATVNLTTSLAPGGVNVTGNAVYTLTGLGKLTGTTGLTINDNCIVTVLTDNDYTGNTTINAAGSLLLGNGGTSGAITGNIITNGSGALVFNRADDMTFAGLLSGPGAVTKNGPGSLRLTGFSASFTGATTVNSGTLFVDGSLGSGVSVNAGAALGGTGSIVGTVAVASGSALQPGHGNVGTLTTGSVGLAGVYACELDGSTSDKLASGGDLDLTGSSLAVSALNPPTELIYVIATYSGALTGTFTGVSGVPAGYSVDFSTPGQIRLAQPGPGQVQAILSVDGHLLTITGTPLDDVVDIRFTDPGGASGDADILSDGSVILHLSDAQRLALQECHVSLYDGDDRFLVHDSVTGVFNPEIVWNVSGGDGADVIALRGPATGSTAAMVLEWQQLRPSLEAGGGDLVAQAQTVMNQRFSWAQTQVEELLRTKTAAVQVRSLALIDRLVADSPDSLVGRAAANFNEINARIANEGPEALMVRKGISESGPPIAGGPNPFGTKGIAANGLPYFGTEALCDPQAVLQRIAMAEARMLDLFDWLPDAPVDGDDGGLEDNLRFNQALAFAHDLGLSLEALGNSAEADVIACSNPVIDDMMALSDYFGGHGDALSSALDADASQAFSPLLAQVTDGPDGTDAFQTDLAAYQAEVETLGTDAATDCDNQIIAIMQSLSDVESQLSDALESMDTPDEPLPADSPQKPRSMSLSLPECSIVTTNTITGGAGADLLWNRRQ